MSLWDDEPVEPEVALVPAEPNPLDELASLFKPLGTWAKQATCAEVGVDATLFDEPGTDDGRTRPERDARAQLAATFCARCPVAAECLADADENGLTGVRGGVLIFDRGRRRKHLLLEPVAPVAPTAA